MNTPQRSEALRETDHAQEHRPNPGVHTLLPDKGSETQPPPRNPVEPYVPDEGAFETFVGGAGI
jgi:hypothetical protein